MKIILISVGTRGDMEPFLVVGEILKEKGHQVICAFPEQFRELAEDSNLEFASLGRKFIDLLDSDIGKVAMGGSGSGFKKFVALIKLARNQTESQKELLYKQCELIENENPDRIVYNGKAIYPVIWGLNNQGKNILICSIPYMHYVKGHTHVAFNSNYGTFFNRLTFSLALFGMVTTAKISIKWLKITKKITRKTIRNALVSNKAIYTISPSLFSRPDYWNENLKVSGFHERNKILNWKPNKELSDFLKKHSKILFITFGSMLNPKPEEKTRILLEILVRNQIPAIINTASGGLVKPDTFDSDLIHFVSQIPYDWIFPKVYGVIHHGGSGTTHLALKYGCATMIIPHIIDQFVWNKIINNIGAGPKGIKIGKITSRNLEPKILELVNNSSFKKAAEEVAGQMKKEDFREELYNSIVN
ncbi:MAG: glycosyltransferase family 1 protein [Bacteroidales bacterium]|nr:MAG: glycosyltransferase family 1 protein [Bacteroidales bacterium]